MMRRSLPMSVIAAGALLAAVVSAQVALPPGAPGAAQQSPVKPAVGTGIVAGRIVDPAGAPIASATVVLTGNPAAASAVRPGGTDRILSDAQGRFAFVALPPGNYSLSGSKSGWLPGAFGRSHPRGGSSPVAIRDGERRADLTIMLWRTAVIGGRVIADNGDPLVGAEVRAIRQTWVAGRRLPAAPLRERTDDRGVFRFSNLQPGDYIVGVVNTVVTEPPALAGAIRSGGQAPRPLLQTQAGVATGTIVLDRATGIAGKDQPLYGALTSSFAPAPAAGKPWMMYPTTFHPSATTMTGAEAITVKVGDVREDVDVRVALTPTWQVSGTVRDSDGPVAWHAVHLVAADAADLPLFDVGVAVTDAKGAFTFYGVPRGPYIARVVRLPWPADSEQSMGLIGGTGQLLQVGIIGRPASGGPPRAIESTLQASESVNVGAAHVAGVTLSLRPAPRVSGTVEFAGDRPDLGKEMIAVYLEPASGREDRNRYPAFVLPDGRFSVEGAIPGRYFIRAQSGPWRLDGATHQGRDVFDRPLELADDIDGVALRLTKTGESVRGAVRADTPRDLLDAVVVWFPVDAGIRASLGRSSVRMSSASVQPEGSFVLPKPPPGDYFMAALAGEDADDWQSPATLTRIEAAAQRVTIGNANVGNVSLSLARLK